MKLIIYDISAIINAGSRAKYSRTYNINGIPTGGLYKLFNYLIQDIAEVEKDEENTKIIACFDSSLVYSLRKMILPEYKSNRSLGELDDVILGLADYEELSESDKEKVALATNVRIQLQLCEAWMNEIGVLPFKAQGYEADDLIYSTVISTAAEKPEIFIRADDEDLYDCCAYNPNTVISSVAGRGVLKTYTGVLLKKICHGCTSDRIPALSRIYPTECVLFERAVTDGIINPFSIHNPDSSLNEHLIDVLNFSESAKMAFLQNMYCVIPFYANLSEMIHNHNKKIDKEYLYMLMATLRMKTLAKKIGPALTNTYSDESRELMNEIKEIIPSYVPKFFGSKLYNV